jgi:hypothetical protein
MVEIAVREDDGRDGGVARRFGVQLVESLDLPKNVGRAVAKDPPAVPCADGDRILGSRLDSRAPRSNGAAIFTTAVPLGDAPASP